MSTKENAELIRRQKQEKLQNDLQARIGIAMKDMDCQDIVREVSILQAHVLGFMYDQVTKHRYGLREIERKEPYYQCPKCGMVSHNANDLKEGYCGHCHDWTGGKP